MSDRRAAITTEVQRIIDNSVEDELMCMDDPGFHVALAERIADYVIEQRETAYMTGRAAGYGECMREWQTSR